MVRSSRPTTAIPQLRRYPLRQTSKPEIRLILSPKGGAACAVVLLADDPARCRDPIKVI